MEFQSTDTKAMLVYKNLSCASWHFSYVITCFVPIPVHEFWAREWKRSMRALNWPITAYEVTEKFNNTNLIEQGFNLGLTF